MRYKFTLPAESVPWARADVPIVVPLSMPMDAASEAFRALGWKLADLQALIRRAMIAHFEALAERQGKEYAGEPSNITGEDEILMNQLTAFASLRAAGFPITWGQARALPLNAFHAVPDGSDDKEILANHAAETDDEEDPQGPSTDSAPVVAGETVQTSEPTGQQ